MRRVVLDMMDRRPMWAMPAWVPEELRAALPDGWELVVIDLVTDGAGDGATRVDPVVLEAVAGAEVYLGYGIHESLLEVGGALRWVHSGAAGVGKSLTPRMLASDVVFTNSAGVHAAPIAETVLAMILHFGRGLDFAVEGKRRGAWWQAPFYAEDAPLIELSVSTVGIIGFGGIGREVARRVASLGARVIGLARRPRPAAEELAPVHGGGSLAERVDVVHGPAGLDRLLAESDIVVVAAPETEETRGLIGAGALERMRPGALLVNVARGRIVDESALVRALSAGKLRGAALDVFATEPLPPASPLWRLSNVLITPHVAATSPRFWERETELIIDNMRRYAGGEPLRNTVDIEAGY
jgi:phosphoglycerate dehydrogenase-like enzyme